MTSDRMPAYQGPSISVVAELTSRKGATQEDLLAAVEAGDYSIAKLQMMFDESKRRLCTTAALVAAVREALARRKEEGVCTENKKGYEQPTKGEQDGKLQV